MACPQKYWASLANRFPPLFSRNPPVPSTSIPQGPTGCAGQPIVPNFSFENGGQPAPTGWSYYGIGNWNVGYTSGSPSGGSQAFSMSLGYPFSGLHETTYRISTDLNTCPGYNYTVKTDFRFRDAAKDHPSVRPLGDCTIQIGNSQGSTITGSAVPGTTPGTWQTSFGQFQAAGTKTSWFIEARCVDNSNAVAVDNVVAKIQPGNVN